VPTLKKTKPATTPRRATRVRAVNADTHCARAMSLVKRGKHGEAAEQFLAASKLEPANWRLPNDAGECFFLAGRYVEALRCYSSAMMMMPDMATVLFNRGMAQAMLGEEDAAFVTLQHVLELEHAHAGAYLEIGKLHAGAGRHWDAIDAFDAALLQRSTDARTAAIALREKARLLLGPLHRDAEGLEVAKLLWERTGDSQALVTLAHEILDAAIPRAARVLEVVLEDAPTDAKALKLRTKLMR
jgi:tetratricopeptide (TPR) repeat protein